MFKFGHKQITVLSAIFLGAILFAIGVNTASAQFDTSVTASRFYFFGYQQFTFTAVTNGNVSVTHHVKTTSTADVKIGDTIQFTYEPEPPFFTAVNGNWDTPYGSFCGTTDDACYVKDVVACGISKCIERNQDQADPLYVSSQSISSISGAGSELVESKRKGFIYWTAVKPSNISITSSDSNVISCNGLTCTVLAPGNVDLTAEINETPVRIWAYTYSVSGGWNWRDGNPTRSYLVPDTTTRPQDKAPYKGKWTMNLSGESAPIGTFSVAPAPGNPYIFLKVNGLHPTLASPLVKTSGGQVSFSWTGHSLLSCEAKKVDPPGDSDPSWWNSDGNGDGQSPMALSGDPDGTQVGSINGYTLPTLAAGAPARTLEYKADCNGIFVFREKGIWGKILAFFRFFKNAFAQVQPTDSVFIEVDPPSTTPPIAHLSAFPPVITRGESSTLTWSCENSTKAKIDPGVMPDTKNPSPVVTGAPIPVFGGSESVSPYTSTKYTLTCTKGEGADAVSTDIDVTVQVGRVCEGVNCK